MSNLIAASSYCDSVFDGTHDTPKSVSKGKLLITSKHISGGTLDVSSAYLISEEDYVSIQKRSAVSQWDILFSMIGSVGEIYLEMNGDVPYAIKNMGVFSCNNEYKAKWLYYYLRSPAAQSHINRYLNGAVQKFLPLGALRDFPVIPFNDEKKALVKVLEVLDAKITCNNHINAELEAMAKTLYDYWFVQFDFPDANGKPYKSSGSKMVYNPTLKREIPAGWRDDSLWEIARYFNGLPMQKHRPKGSEYLPVIKIKEMGEGISDSSEKASPDIPRDAIVVDGDVLFSWSATLDVKIWSQGKGALNQHIFKVTSDKYPKTFYYFELLAYLAHFKMMAEKRKTTMGHITQDHLKQSRICIPPTELLSRAHEQIEPILKNHLLHEKENQHLSQLRDWLLPMLMNGQVTVV